MVPVLTTLIARMPAARQGSLAAADSLGNARRLPSGRWQARYVGLAKTRLQHILIAVALNVLRLAAWFAGQPRACTRQSPFARLIPASAVST